MHHLQCNIHLSIHLLTTIITNSRSISISIQELSQRLIITSIQINVLISILAPREGMKETMDIGMTSRGVDDNVAVIVPEAVVDLDTDEIEARRSRRERETDDRVAAMTRSVEVNDEVTTIVIEAIRIETTIVIETQSPIGNETTEIRINRPVSVLPALIPQLHMYKQLFYLNTMSKTLL